MILSLVQFILCIFATICWCQMIKDHKKYDLLEEILFTLSLRRSSKKFTILNVILADESAYTQMFFSYIAVGFHNKHLC